MYRNYTDPLKALRVYVVPLESFKGTNPLIGFKTKNCEMSKSMFLVFLQNLNILDLGFAFLVKDFVYSRLETFGNPQFGQTNTKFSFEKVCFKSHQGVNCPRREP